jgi:transcriptional regulator with XRE-family HTH domain
MPRSPFGKKYRRLRALLVEARRTAELTQADVAKRLARPQSFVSKYETGERRIDVIEFLDIARAIGADWAALLRRLERSKGT